MKTRNILLLGLAAAAILWFVSKDKKTAAEGGDSAGGSSGPAEDTIFNETGTAKPGEGQSYVPSQGGSETSSETGTGTNTSQTSQTSQTSGTSSAGSGSSAAIITASGATAGEGEESYVPGSVGQVML